MVSKKFYGWAFVLAVAAMAFLFIAARLYDDYKFASIERTVRGFSTESDETRLLLAYGDAFGKENPFEFCDALELNARRQADRGYALVNRLREFEKANLLADYEQVRRQYYLNNFELWLQRTVAKRECSQFNPELQKNSTLVLFFTDTLSSCNDCIVQGELLDQLREKCPQLQVITLASDLKIAPVELLKKKFGVQSVPSIVVDNSKTTSGAKTREELVRELGCSA